MSPLEVAANGFLLGSVYLARRNSVHTWWSGMVAVSLYGVLFFGVRLYADVLLQGFFFGTSVLGWWQWTRGGEGGGELPISGLDPRRRQVAAGAAVAITLAAGTVFWTLTDAALPYADSFILAGSVVAQLLMMRRVLDHWYFWIAVDVVAVIVYAAKGLFLTATVYLLLLALCVQGLRKWRHLLQEQGVFAPQPAPVRAS